MDLPRHNGQDSIQGRGAHRNWNLPLNLIHLLRLLLLVSHDLSAVYSQQQIILSLPPLSLSISLSLSLPHSRSISLFLSHSLILFLSLPLSLSIYLSLSLSLLFFSLSNFSSSCLLSSR